MNISKALDHQKWRLQNGKPSKKDIEAYNAIVDYKTFNETKNMSNNESLAKLWIHQMILLSRTRLYTGEMCINSINEILEKSVYDWCLILKKEIPMMRFNSVGIHKYPLKQEDMFNITKIEERNKKIINEFETELTECFNYEISEDNIIKFVEKEITRIINKFEK